MMGCCWLVVWTLDTTLYTTKLPNAVLHIIRIFVPQPLRVFDTLIVIMEREKLKEKKKNIVHLFFSFFLGRLSSLLLDHSHVAPRQQGFSKKKKKKD